MVTLASALVGLVALVILAIDRPAAAPGGPDPSIVGCAPTSLASALTVFTGRVVSVTNESRTATVSVDRVHRGGPVSARVEVRGTRAESSGIVSAIDRTYAVGAEYVFAPQYGGDPRFEETACSPTRPRSADTDAAYPPSAGREPAPGGASTTDGRATLPLVLGVAGGVALLAVLVFGPRRLRRHHRG